MPTPELVNRYYQQQQSIAGTTVAAVKKLWRGMGSDFDQSWSLLAPALLDTVQLGRAAAATTSAAFTPALLESTGQSAPPAGLLNTARFIETAPDGRSMESLLDRSVIVAKSSVKSGATTSFALAQAEAWITGMLLTVMADTGRAIVGADIAQRPAIAGYVRMLNGPSCSRCIILAGKWFRWNEGFQRHPRCDCRHIPAAEDVAGDLTTDPYAAFKAMSPAEQEKAFGRIEARAIRDGADIFRVVNLKARGLGTARAANIYGTPSRMTIDDIYRTAGHRTNAIKMMEREGFITGPQTRDGNIVGRMRESFTAPISRPIVPGSNRARTLEARRTGVRDPLDRATMTAAERRLYDAHYRLSFAEMRGTVAPSITNSRGLRMSDADKFVKPRTITPEGIAELRKDLTKQIAALQKLAGDGKAPPSLLRLARLLGLL